MRWNRVLIVAGFVIAGGAGDASAVIVYPSYGEQGACCSPQGGSCVEDGCQHIKTGYRRNVLWPWPYVCPDRVAAQEPFDIMVRNGWRRQCLLGGHYFNPETHKLTTAGELQVRWILTQAPPTRRQIYVEQAINPAETEARLAVVRQYASQIAIDGQTPQVFASTMMAEGRSAATVDMVNVKFMENMMPPVLPAATSSNGTSTGQ